MNENDIEVLPDGRIALILHDGKLERGMSTHEVKKAFLSALNLEQEFYLFKMAGYVPSVKRLELK